MRAFSTITARVRRYLKRHPYSTNVQIARALKASPATVSSITNRLYHEGKINRAKTVTSVLLNDRAPWLYWAY